MVELERCDGIQLRYLMWRQGTRPVVRAYRVREDGKLLGYVALIMNMTRRSTYRRQVFGAYWVAFGKNRNRLREPDPLEWPTNPQLRRIDAIRQLRHR